VHGYGVHVVAAGRGVVVDALRAAIGAEHRRVVIARPFPVETVGLEGVVERLSLQFRGVGERADRAKEDC
jgi:hypothetical protein